MIDRLLASLRSLGSRTHAGSDRTDAWVGAVASALAVVERDRTVGESHDLWSGDAFEAPDARADGPEGSALRLDLAFLERQILVAVMELPERDRDLVLGRYRDGRSMDELARLEGTRKRALTQRLRKVLSEIGGRVRDACGGSASVYVAALAAVAARREADTRRGLRWQVVTAAAAVLMVAVLWSALRGSERVGPTDSTRSVAAGARSELPAVRTDDHSRDQRATTPERTDPTLPSTAAALEADQVAALADLQGRVTLLGLPPGDGYLGQARAASQGVEHVQLVDKDGQFSFAALGAGTWRITLRLTGFESVVTEVEIDPLDPPAPLELEARPVGRVEVSLFDQDGRPLFENAGLADDWAVTNGLTAWLTSTPPDARVERVDLAGGDDWARLGTFERLDPIDMARPSVLGTLVVERPSAAQWISLVFGDHVLSTQPFVVGTSPVVFEVDTTRLESMRSSVKLLLRSLLGLDAAGAIVRLIGPNGEVLQRRVGEDGILRLDGLPPGRWIIEVMLRGHGVLRRAYDVDGSGDGLSEELDLSASLRVFGQVKNLAGVPIGAGIRAIDLSLLQADPSTLQYQPNTNSSQFAAGTYSFSDLSSDSDWVLVIEHEDFALTAYAVDADQTSHSMDLTATPGHDVTLTWGPGAVEPGRMILLRDANMLPLKVMMVTADLAHQVKLKPGSYNYALWENGVWLKQITFEVPQSNVQVGVSW